MLVQDVTYGRLSEPSDDHLDKETTTQFDVYIGNSLDYLENTKCTTTPRLSENYQDILKEWDNGG